MKKVSQANEAHFLEQIPNVGKAVVHDLHLLGIQQPHDLKKRDAYQLYVALCEKTRLYHDPCMLDTLIAAVYFMDGKGAKKWWDFTIERKARFHEVEAQVKIFKR
ncbi:MAG: helix-hairpin-helix domain-containing protein [Gammaproteobacteria bacterium]|nr:helix-hairpin-helix domain-containing protein [Gammaproteobacteria bacterium]